MNTTNQTNRRKFLDKLLKGAAFGTVGLLFTNRLNASNNSNDNSSNLYAMWTHGSEGKMEGRFHDGKDAISFGSKLIGKIRAPLTAGYLRGVRTGSKFEGTSIILPGEAAATMVSTSGGAVFTIWDSGTKAKSKNGEFWVHFTIPTPVIANNVRAKVSKILVKCSSTNVSFHISDVELWDANERIFHKSNQKLWGPDRMHGFSFRPAKSVKYGLCMSLKIVGERVSADEILEISGVGVDLMI
ncbi:hypothetical protein [Winogradskyella helgolandensis]|uniref:hypothetical protein n=1 Tax=Winogradskyella helgolandensis TaxID=2697010 RepID=UPI0015BEA55A|nr:hypothetical protein [Winogradskyella helgolandensis]